MLFNVQCISLMKELGTQLTNNSNQTYVTKNANLSDNTNTETKKNSNKNTLGREKKMSSLDALYVFSFV